MCVLRKSYKNSSVMQLQGETCVPLENHTKIFCDANSMGFVLTLRNHTKIICDANSRGNVCALRKSYKNSSVMQMQGETCVPLENHTKISFRDANSRGKHVCP
jgi:hypothetical protein